ncbi:hypothetical protein SAY87_021475 [Trapa incisa]|uniref:Uncharacterized protein n=1 Tax=Trapa incisa TaxID=236973 RepID=A0AAN7JTA4_9MYRT|nr:hypothetical protein SAY87_021475 [Trapa incisa]
MVGVFRRSLSFPNKLPNRPPKPPAISQHTRSISLPSRSHPLVSQLRDSISDLHRWSSSSPLSNNHRSSDWLCTSLSRLRSIHESIDDVLQLPQTLQTLSQHRHLVEKLLEDLLRFVVAYDIFRTSVMTLKEEQAAAQVAVRKRDQRGVASYLRLMRRTSRDMRRLASTVRPIEKNYGADTQRPTVGPDAELVGAILDGVEVTVKVSVALFGGISASLTPRTAASSSWMRFKVKRENKPLGGAVYESFDEIREVNAEIERLLRGLRKMKDEEVRTAMRRMQELDGCIGGIERESERVFRSLISTRVSLLNTLAQ